MAEVLGSQWGGENYGLNKHLIAKIYPVDSKGVPDTNVGENASAVMVAAPLTDGNLDASFNWQSPFENTGTDSKLPAISQLLQSGQAETMLMLISSILPSDSQGIIGEAKNKLLDLAAQAKKLTGRTGITKLNSRQVFSGMPPIKIPITLYFRAWADPMSEVEKPINQLFAWALPQFLAQSVAEEVLKDVGKKNFNLSSLFPSTIPRFVALEYGGRTYKPLVIESIGQPLIMPRDSNGAMLSASIQLTLATLDAWDIKDYADSLK